MPNSLEIRFGVNDQNETVSKFVVAEGGQVFLHGPKDAKVDVTFREASPLCIGNQPQTSISVTAGDWAQYTVCPGTASQSFKYTATVDGAQPEDPYILVQGTPETGVVETNPAIKFVCEPSLGESLALVGGGFILGIGAVMLINYVTQMWRNMPRP